ncbi:RTA1-like protein [Trametes polyzona]|nr:RTA1-like protein [Trametes polyzona]
MSSEASNDRHLTSPYGYVPTGWVNLVFLALFGLSTLVHVGQTIRYRSWWLIPTVVIAGCGEVTGWGGRAWSHYSVLNRDAYLMQIVTLIISPTPLIGALFISFGRLSLRLGQEYSRLSPGLYSRIFLTCDFVSLVIQAIGGGLAASADDADTSKMGSNIMLGGIIFQLVSLSVFCILVVEYLVRRMQDKPLRASAMNDRDSTQTFVAPPRGMAIEKPMKLLIVGLAIEVSLLYIRGIYRTVELADGWNGKIIETEWVFIVFDGIMVVATMLCLNIFHPGRLLNAAANALGTIPLGSKLSV